MGDIFLFNPSNDALSAKGNEKVTKKQSVGTHRGKGLSDITNLQPKQKVSDEGNLVLMCDQELLQQLQQENATLRKQLVECNELYGFEMHKLRANFQNYQLQNLQLAQANGQILCQLNTSKDKLKVVEHELTCKKNLLAIKTMGLLEVKNSGQCQEIDKKKETSKEAGKSSQEDGNNETPCSTNNRQHSTGVNSAAKVALVEEDPDIRRYPIRRQSSRFKSVELEPAEDMPDTHGVASQNMSKRPEACPMSETSVQGSQEAFVSSSAVIDDSKPCTNNDKHPRKGKRGSVMKDASDDEKAKRPRTRSSILKSEKQHTDFTKDMVKKEAALSLTHDVRKIQDVKVNLQDNSHCSGGTGTGQLGDTEMSTTKGISQVKKTETKRPCSRRQSSRRKCKDEEPIGWHTQDDNNEKSENHSVQRTLLGNTEKVPELVKSSPTGRPRRAAKVQSYKEIPLRTKMRRPL